jgi:hypothetical protein
MDLRETEAECDDWNQVTASYEYRNELSRSRKGGEFLALAESPPNQGTIASWDHPPPEANPPVLTCQDITPVSASTSLL